jgi:hypothetical protein
MQGTSRHEIKTEPEKYQVNIIIIIIIIMIQIITIQMAEEK